MKVSRAKCLTYEVELAILLIFTLFYLTVISIFICICISLVSAFRRKTRLIKWASVCVCLCVCVSVYSFGPPLTISIPVMRLIRNVGDTYTVVSYRNSPTPLIPFLNFENCAREKLLKLIFSPFD